MTEFASSRFTKQQLYNAYSAAYNIATILKIEDANYVSASIENIYLNKLQ